VQLPIDFKLFWRLEQKLRSTKDGMTAQDVSRLLRDNNIPEDIELLEHKLNYHVL